MNNYTVIITTLILYLFIISVASNIIIEEMPFVMDYRPKNRNASIGYWTNRGRFIRY